MINYNNKKLPGKRFYCYLIYIYNIIYYIINANGIALTKSMEGFIMASNTVINTNIRALNSHRNLSSVGTSLAKSSERLSSGKKINHAADDAAGLAISEKMRAQIKGLDMADKNAQDAISLIQTAEGSMSEIESMVQRIRELTVQAANDSNATSDREKIANEIRQLQEEITDMAGRTEFNTKTLATGKYSTTANALFFQIGANKGQKINLQIGGMTSTKLGIQGVADFVSRWAREAAGGSKISTQLSVLDTAIKTVSDEVAKLGAKQNRLEYTSNNLQVSSENLSSAKSRIEDADMAKEMMNVTAKNVLQQAATAMLAQANQSTSQVVSLLQ